jgi:hypothetical protein
VPAQCQKLQGALASAFSEIVAHGKCFVIIAIFHAPLFAIFHAPLSLSPQRGEFPFSGAWKTLLQKVCLAINEKEKIWIC